MSAQRTSHPLSGAPVRPGVEPARDRTADQPLVRLVLECALERLSSLLAGLSCFALPLHRGFFVVRALLHLLKEAVLEHLLLELLQSPLYLVVDDHDLHSGHPQMPRRAMGPERDRVVDDVHLTEPLRPVLDSTGDRWESLARLLNELTCVVDDAPPPARSILRRRDRCDLHALTTDSGAGLGPSRPALTRPRPLGQTPHATDRWMWKRTARR